MKFSEIILQKKNPIAWGLIILIIVIIFLVAEAIVSFVGASKLANKLAEAEQGSEITNPEWNFQENRDLFKTKLWLENQIELAKEDSMSMGIDLIDSVVQVQIKGLPLMQSKVLFIRHKNFLSDIDAEYYSKLFAKSAKLVNEKSNFAKKPLRKMKVVEGADAELLTTDTLKHQRFYWEFVADNNIRIVINGCEKASDSLIQQPSFRMDMLKFRLKAKSKDASGLRFHPTLFLWLDDKEAKAIYRALPNNNKIAIRV